MPYCFYIYLLTEYNGFICLVFQFTACFVSHIFASNFTPQVKQTWNESKIFKQEIDFRQQHYASSVLTSLE